MSVTMMSRLMLNLHERAVVGIFTTDPVSEDSTVFTSLHVTEFSTQWDSDVEHSPFNPQIGVNDFNTYYQYPYGT